MKPTRSLQLLALATMLSLSGCAGLDRAVYDSAKRPPTATVDIYQNDKVPDRHYKEVAAFMSYGMRDAEVSAQNKMIAEAKQIGANGIIFTVQPAGVQVGVLGAASKFAFKGIAIVYE